MARAFNHPSAKDIELDCVLHALSDPIRRVIITKLLEGEAMNCAQAACKKIPASTISFHYKVLRESGLIHSEKKGVEVINIVRKADIDKRFPGLLETVLKLHKAQK